MNSLLKLLRATHCSSTHHYFAIDALPLVQTTAGERLVSLLLRHHDRYLRGARDPDVRFCDYQNHVIHVTEGYWGGAPRVAHQWYDRLQRYLRQERHADAAHAAGVLSHYFTDPLQPLHTQQCELEKVLHRPIEWSVTKCYPEIYRDWQQDDHRVVFQLSDGPGWLGEAILHGARFANRKYGQLLREYDLQRAIEQPRAGLNAHLRASLAEVIGLAVTGWARVLERAAFDAEATRRKPLPVASQAVAMMLAGSCVPWRWWAKRRHCRQEQHAIASLIEEFRETGTLRDHLSAEVDIVHRVIDVYHDEKRWKKSRELRLASKATVIRVDSVTVDDAREDEDREIAPVILPFNASGDSPPEDLPQQASEPRLSLEDPLTASPSIGHETSARLAEAGIRTIGDLVLASPNRMAEQLQAEWITADTISRWQRQARLLCEIADLDPEEALWLVGAGFDSAVSVAQCGAALLHRKVSEFALTVVGRQSLRGSEPPRLAEVKRWIALAQSAEAKPKKRRSA